MLTCELEGLSQVFSNPILLDHDEGFSLGAAYNCDFPCKYVNDKPAVNSLHES